MRFHEIGHIINGDVGDKLIDYESSVKNEVEEKANDFARNVLIEQKRFESFVEKGNFTLRAIRQFCLENEIPSYILVGRLQKEKILKWWQYSSEKVKYDFVELPRGISTL